MRFLLIAFLFLTSCHSQSPKLTLAVNPSEYKLLRALDANLKIIIAKNWDAAKINQALKTGLIDAYIGSMDLDPSLLSSLVAKDAIVLLGNQNNSVSNLSLDDLRSIFSYKSLNWNLFAGPNSPIVIIDQDEFSQTKMEFYKILLPNIPIKTKVSARTLDEIAFSLIKFPNAISYMNFSDFKYKLKSFNIDSIPASFENIKQGYFPIIRKIKIYYDKNTLRHNSKTQSMIDFLEFVHGTRAQKIIEELKYIPLDQSELDEIQANLQPILIGVGVPLEGTYTDLAKSIVDAAKLAVDKANTENFLDGKNFEIVVCNDKSQIDFAIKCAQKFIDMGVLGVVGHLTSQVSIEASKLYVSNSIPMISPASTHPWLTERPNTKSLVFRTVGRDDMQAKLIAKSLANLPKHPIKIAIFNNSTVYGKTLSSLIETEINNIALDKVTLVKSLEQGKNQYHNEVQALDAGALVFVGEPIDAAQLVKELALTNQKNVLFFGADGIFSQRYIEKAGLRAESTYVIGSPLDKDSRLYQDFYQAYLTQYKIEPSAFAMNAYDATMILIKAIKQSSLSKISVSKAIQQIDYRGITGRLRFNSIGDPIDSRMSLYRVEQGEFVRVDYAH